MSGNNFTPPLAARPAATGRAFLDTWLAARGLTHDDGMFEPVSSFIPSFLIGTFDRNGKLRPDLSRTRWDRTEAKYTSPKGVGVVIFGPRPDSFEKFAAAKVKYIAEGEGKALALAKLGLPVLGIGGVHCWHLKGESTLHPNLDGVKKGDTVYLAVDGDCQTNDSVRSGAAGELFAIKAKGAVPKLFVLNSGEPTTVGRMLVYYEYLGRARTTRLGEIREQVTRLEELDEALAAESARLADLEEERQRDAAALDAARAARALALSELKARIATHSTELKELRANAAALEDLLARLRAALEEFDSPELQGTPGKHRSFSEVRGHLPWPAHGRLLAGYGDARPGGLKWTGVLLGTRPAGEVRAAYYGRVIYADWLPGLGLLAILDHGGGYLSLYAHNDRIFKAAGERVRPGEVIAASSAAAAGRPELYFEIRQGARPLDPRPWLKGMPRP